MPKAKENHPGLNEVSVAIQEQCSNKQEIVLMLRVWKDKAEWQASLKDIETKEVQYFKTIKSLSTHLNSFTAELVARKREKEA